MYYTLFQGAGSLWFWNLRAANHEIIAQSEGYRNRADALNAINLLKQSGSAPIR